MKITVTAFLFAERNVKVDHFNGQFYFFCESALLRMTNFSKSEDV